MPSDVLEYRGYTAFVNYSPEDGCLHGKLEGIRSTILFDDADKPIRESFEEAVDEYLDYCERNAVDPEKPHEGPRNVSSRNGRYKPS